MVGQLFVMFVCPAKIAKLIELLFGMLTWVGPRNHVLDMGADLRQFLGRKWRPIVKYRDTYFELCKNG